MYKSLYMLRSKSEVVDRIQLTMLAISRASELRYLWHTSMQEFSFAVNVAVVSGCNASQYSKIHFIIIAKSSIFGPPIILLVE